LGTSFTIVDVKGNEIDTVYSIGRMFDISSIYAYVSALGKNGTFSYQESIKFREGFSDIVPFFDVAEEDRKIWKTPTTRDSQFKKHSGEHANPPCA
jgi:hypothetical protein